MFVETIIPREDLVALLETALPLAVHFEGGGSLEVFGLGDITLVPDQGLRVACKAKVLWPALGIPFHVTLNSVTIMLRPKVVKLTTGEALRLDVSIEEADFAGLPDFADEAIRKRIDEALRARRHELAFDFTSLLRRRVVIPENVQPLSALSIEAAWAKLRITTEAMVLVLSIRPTLERGELAPLPIVAPLVATSKPKSIVRAEPIAGGAVIFAGAAFLFGALLASAIFVPSRR